VGDSLDVNAIEWEGVLRTLATKASLAAIIRKPKDLLSGIFGFHAVALAAFGCAFGGGVD